MLRRELLVLFFATGFLFSGESFLSAAEDVLPPGDQTPVLRLETGGARSNVNSLAFSPDGRYLYAAGWDKLVQVWNLNQDGRFEYNSAAGLRVPTGSGNYGGLNAMAVSDDGHWLAVAGLGHARDLSTERNTGWIVPSGMRTDSALFDEGMIYVFNLQSRETSLLRGHRGPVQAMAFVRRPPSQDAKPASIPPELVSIAEEPLEDQLTKPEIRIWNVQKKNTLATLTTFPNAEDDQEMPLPGLRGFRPGLTAWSTGPDSNQIRVALAWGDNQFRVWDVQTGKVAYGIGGDVLLTVLPLSDDHQSFITGAHGHVGVWSPPPFAPGRLAPQTFQEAQIPEVNNKRFHLPRASALIHGFNGNPDSIAMVLTQHLTDEQGQETGRAKYRLLILSCATPVKTIREIELWEGAIRQPSVAVTGDGQTLAVAGHPQNQIHVFKMTDLIAGKTPKPEIISSSGILFRDAAFVREGDRWGIQLSQSPRDASGQFPGETLVFDIASRRVDKFTDKWRRAEANANGWTWIRTQTPLLNVERPGKPALTLKLEKDYQPVATAFCPASNVCPVPLVAVASRREGQPLLQIFDGETGSPLRWCEAHTERIRSLGFSEDGRMLISVAGDRTVAVWTVTDLVERVLKKRGRIPDLVVKARQNQLIVIEAGASSLQKGDVVSSLHAQDKAVVPKTSKEFYRFILDCQPGDQVDVTVRRNGAGQVVECLIDQAIDESKPLFSLFVSPSARDNEWDWIGWHPLGNFDFRGDGVERQLGWHFNTGDPLHPASFATVGEYRDKFVRPDLLQSLLAKQKLEVAVVPAVTPQIQLSFRNKTNDQATDGVDAGRLVIKSRDVLLVAEVKGIPDRRISGLNITVDTEFTKTFSQEAHGEWIADLSDVDWKRGSHQFEVKLSTPDGEFVRAESVPFQPRPTSIRWKQTWDKAVTTDTVNVQAEVTPTGEPLHVELKVYPPEKGARKIKEWNFKEGDKPFQISADIPLEPGESMVRLDAWNTSSGRPTDKFEPVQKVVPITREMPSSFLHISDLAVSVGPAEARVPVTPTDQYVYQANSPNVWMTGLIKSDKAIGQLQLIVGDKPEELPGFKPGTQLEYTLEKKLTLRPGRPENVILKIRAGESAEVRELQLEYVPLIPSISSLKIEPGAPLRQLPSDIPREPFVYYSGYDNQRLTLEALFEGNFDQSFTGTLIINDRPGRPLTIRPGQAEFTTSLELADGTSIVELQLDVPGASQKSQPVKVVFRRPPVLGKPQAADQVLAGQNFTLICDAESEIPVRSAVLAVGEQRKKLKVFHDQDNPGHWSLNFTGELSLNTGNHQLSVIATNDDGRSIEPAVHMVHVGQIASPPVLELLSGETIVSVDSSVEIEFKVKSTAPAEVRIDVQCDNGKVDQTRPIAEHPGDDQPMKTSVTLAEGVNTVSMTAYSKSGMSEKQVLRISYVAPPVVIDVVKIDGQNPDFKLDWKTNQKELQLRNSVPKSMMPTEFRVSARESLKDKGPLSAEIWVNSFKLPTVPVQIDSKNPKAATFAAIVPLNHREKNLIQTKIIGKEGPQPSELGHTGSMIVDCENPVRGQTLFLLLLGTGDGKLLEQKARQYLNATRMIQPGVWKSEHFSEIYILNAMNENVPYVQGQISLLHRKMMSRLKAFPESGSNTIVAVLYGGQINLRPDEFHFQTEKLPPNRTAELNEMLSGRLLESQLNKTFGAHLLLLDLEQKSIATDSIWSKAPHIGVLIANWNSLVSRPVESRLVGDLKAQYPKLRELILMIERKRSAFSGQLEMVDRLQNHYDLQFGADE